VVATAGPQIVTLTFDFPDPHVAAGTLKALLDEFSSEVLASQRTLAPEDLTYVTQQVADQQELASSADAEVARYVAQHQELGSPNPPPDLTLAGLQQVADTAHQRYAYLIQRRDRAQFQVRALNAGSSPQFHVVDSPSPPSRPNSLLVSVLSGLATGLGVGLLVAGTTLAVLASGDRTLRGPADGESA